MLRNIFIAILALVLAAGSVLLAQGGGSATKPTAPPEDPMVTTIFKEADVNADSFITWTEAQKAGAQYKRDLYTEEVFSDYDEDDDGKLSRGEVGTYVTDTKGKNPTSGGY